MSATDQAVQARLLPLAGAMRTFVAVSYSAHVFGCYPSQGR